MPWKQIRITTTAANAEIVSELLMAVGALAVTFEDAADQPIYEPWQETPLWQKTFVCGLFDTAIDLEKIWKFLQEHTEKTAILSVFVSETLADKDWIKETQKNFPPLKFGKKLWVVPSWEKINVPGSVIVLLDPGIAFGTGTHETTSLCLEWLEENIKPHDRVIDYGCGSGILGIAALKLGARQVWAIDHDPQALAATRNNAKNNQLSKEQIITATPEQTPPWQANILVANILAQPLIALAPTFAKLVKDKGKVVLSGILREQADNVNKSYFTWFKMLPATFKNEWARLEGIRRANYSQN